MNCSNCGKEIKGESLHCEACDVEVQQVSQLGESEKGKNEAVVLLEKTEKEEEIEYAGFWVRLLAAVIDGMILFFPIFIPIFFIGAMDVFANPDKGDLSFLTYVFIMVMLYPVQISYYALLETSKWRATIGKKLCGIYVVNRHHQNMSLKASYFRNLMKIFCLYYFAPVLIAPLFTKNKQNFYDIFASTYVVYKK